MTSFSNSLDANKLAVQITTMLRRNADNYEFTDKNTGT